ncbi:hypothetical protein [Brachyspira aalborgi]|uniref:hypothetical protein n=1 Tax=Brachyspira aalborgi TaxID=29522 RepID=UPI002664FB00|nr:hypothetical protein [Brachyspira aalborgi]
MIVNKKKRLKLKASSKKLLQRKKAEDKLKIIFLKFWACIFYYMRALFFAI